MARRYEFTNSFAAGEIAPEFVLRKDIGPRNEGLKTGRNIRLLQGGGFKRRFGTVDLGVDLGADAVAYTFGAGPNATLLIFKATKFQHRNLDGSLIQEVTGAPWTVDDLRTMQAAIGENDIVVASQSFWPQRLKRAAGVWSLADFVFLEGLNASIRQPYWRYADLGVSIAPSAYTGSITVTASSAIFSADYVGTRIRYLGIEILITAYTDTTHVTGTVIGACYTQLDVTVAASTAFIIGQSVQGEDSQIKGIVTGLPSSTVVTVQLTGGYTPFTVTENLIGPTGVSEIGAFSIVAAPAAISSWDEQMISSFRGYPGACGFHRTRLLFGDFPNAKALVGSAVGEIDDFDVGDGLDSDAIVDVIGRDVALNIKHFGSTEQLILLTEAGPHYVPEQVTAPLSPTNDEVFQIGPEVCAAPAPVLVSEGLLFSEEGSGRLMIAVPTGNVRRSWDVNDLSELAFHLAGTPVKIELLAAFGETDRLVFQLRDDGVFAVMSYGRKAQFTSWVTWDTDGEFRSMAAAAGALYVVVKRTIANVVKYRLERMDEAVIGDGVVNMPDGDLTHLDGQEVAVWKPSGIYVGRFTVTAGAVVDLPSDIIEYDAGFDFDLLAETVPPIDPNMGMVRRERIVRAVATCTNTIGLTINGKSPSGFAAGVGLGGDVQPVTGELIFRPGFGHTRQPTLRITQTPSGPLEMSSVTGEVTS